ncbi:MAG TPA: STM4013/SEN3800 family hydrolase [Pyrinomonadaceae bacterium]|nr:STM4013/SEN3800 family hydrolase [Pyrinomonadaceae bacterium]
MLDARQLVGNVDILFITLDTLRYDVAQEAFLAGLTPNFAKILPRSGWEKRHTPASFTYAAHHSFFAGFLPTPAMPGPHPRLFAANFEGSATVTDQTCIFDEPDIVSGLSGKGYATLCIGGTGFFNKQNALGNVLPGLFEQSHWDQSLGVTDARSTENQVKLAIELLNAIPKERRVFLFINVSALHQPNCIFLQGSSCDSVESHAAALVYVDSQLPPLFAAMQKRAPVLAIVCSDHGTAYGEDGYTGHRAAHEVIWTVPYAEVLLEQI